MYDSKVDSDYNLRACHACLSSNRVLTMVGDLVDVYRKICDNSRMLLTTQTHICWECLALLKKVRAFKKKVDNAQKILDYCIDKHNPVEDSLSDLTTSLMETTSFVPVVTHDVEEDKLANVQIELMESDDCIDLWEEGEQMFKIENVRGHCDIVGSKPSLDIWSDPKDVAVEPSPTPAPAQRPDCSWKRSAMLVFKRISAHKYAMHFLRPVVDDLAPGYSGIVKRPMDLSTIRGNIRSGVISSTAELHRALLLMFSNALMYNSSDHVMHHKTQEFRLEAMREISLLMEAEAVDGSPSGYSRRAR